MRQSLGLIAYRLATLALTPVIPIFLRQRSQQGKEDPERIGERLGVASKDRPQGTLIWVHGASVGECVAALPLIDKLLEDPNRSVLVTSGTVNAAKVMSQRLPERALHQYVPLDTPRATARFLDHWKPDLALFVDSDLWPNLLRVIKKHRIPLALVNARISERSFNGWRGFPRTARALLSHFDVCLAQDHEIADRLTILGAKDVRMVGSLKADSDVLPADPQKLAELKDAIGNRPVFLVSSTHPGEHETLLPAHDGLREKFPDLLTIAVPRHPERGPEIAMLCGARTSQQRSKDPIPKKETSIYIADTIGELGLFYRLAPFAFVGGSLVRHGGQNPLEPANLNCGVLAGPYTDNFTTAYNAIFEAQGMGRVRTSRDIIELAERLLSDPGAARAFGEKAGDGARSLGGAVGKTMTILEDLLRHARA